MRLAVLSVHTCPLASLGGKETGGMNVYVRETCAELGRRGVRVDVFTRSQDPAVPRRVELIPGVVVHHVPAGPETPYPKYGLLQYMGEFVQGVMHQAPGPYDLLFTHYWLSGVAGLDLRNKWGIPMVHMFHTMGWIKNLVAKDQGEKEGETRLIWEERVAREADALVAPHPLERAQLVWQYRACPGRIRVVPCGVDLSLFRPIDPAEARRALGLDNSPRLIFVGRLDPIKGLDTLLKAMVLLKGKAGSPGALPSLLVVGGPPWEAGTEPPPEILKASKQVQDLGIQDMVHLLGPRQQNSLPLYYSASLACVLPSRYESFGMAALEAMACGVPVVASRVGGLSYTVLDGESGILVPEGDAEALANTIRDLIERPGWRAQMGARASRRAQRFSWPGVVDGLMVLFEELLGGTNPLSEGHRRTTAVCQSPSRS